MISIKRRSVGDIIANVVIYILLTLIAVIMVIPFIYVIAASFATEAEIQTRPIFFIPDSPTLDAYERYGYKSIPFIVNFSMCNSNRYIY
jgi:putative aldouronate transport system permease protein